MIRKIAAAILIIFGGFYGIIFFFADLANGETWYFRSLIAFTYYFIFSAIISWLIYPKWKLTLFLIWGVVAVAILNLRTVFSEGINSELDSLRMVIVPLLATLIGVKIIYFFKPKKAA